MVRVWVACNPCDHLSGLKPTPINNKTAIQKKSFVITLPKIKKASTHAWKRKKIRAAQPCGTVLGAMPSKIVVLSMLANTMCWPAWWSAPVASAPRPRSDAHCYQPDTHNFFISPRYKLLVAVPEKAGYTLMADLMCSLDKGPHKNPGTHSPFRGFPVAFELGCDFDRAKACPMGFDAAGIERLLHDPQWTKMVLYREPLARLLSGFRSKCEDGHDPDRSICTEAFGARNASFEQAIDSLRQQVLQRNQTGPDTLPPGKSFDHFRPQTQMALNTLKDRATIESTYDFAFRIPENASEHAEFRDAMAFALQKVGADPSRIPVFERNLQHPPPPPRRGSLGQRAHETHALDHLQAYYSDAHRVRTLLAIYAQDYAAFQMEVPSWASSMLGNARPVASHPRVRCLRTPCLPQKPLRTSDVKRMRASLADSFAHVKLPPPNSRCVNFSPCFCVGPRRVPSCKWRPYFDLDLPTSGGHRPHDTGTIGPTALAAPLPPPADSSEPAVVAYLFLVGQQMEATFAAMWERYFAGCPAGSFSVHVHSPRDVHFLDRPHRKVNSHRMKLRNNFGMVDAMLRLYESALAHPVEAHHTADWFHLVSNRCAKPILPCPKSQTPEEHLWRTRGARDAPSLPPFARAQHGTAEDVRSHPRRAGSKAAHVADSDARMRSAQLRLRHAPTARLASVITIPESLSVVYSAARRCGDSAARELA